MEWGGDWSSPVDKPHFQLKQWGSTPNKLKKLYGSVENFKKTWSSYKTSETKEDIEMVTEGKALVNGKEYKIDRILKDGINYIRAANFGNMGFQVAYDADTKAVVIDNRVDELDVNVDGKDMKVNAVNIEGYNYVKLRDLAEILGKEVQAVKGKVLIK